MNTAAMIVMEAGSEWPGQVGDQTNVVIPGEEGDDLLERTQAKLAALRREHQSVRVAVLACNAAVGAAAVARAQLARVLLATVTTGLRGRLILSASARATGQLRNELFRLAGALTEELRGKRATVSVRFSGPPRRSRWSARARLVP
jgi:hypothetical protein